MHTKTNVMQKVSRLLIKGMVCNRCMLIVSNALANLGYTPENIALGEVALDKGKMPIDIGKIEEKLEQFGFSLLEDRKEKLVRTVKTLVAEVYSGNYDFPDGFRFSDLLKERWNSYEAVSDAFIALEKKTIERYLIEYRINKVKEYLVYTNKTLSEIAFRLNFNSVAHLSAQFKQHTGLTPSHFKEVKKGKTEVIFSTN